MSSAPPEREDAGICEELIILALVFGVGALAAYGALVDPSRTTSGTLGALAMLLAGTLFGRQLLAVRAAKRQPSTRSR